MVSTLKAENSEPGFEIRDSDKADHVEILDSH
jgi:hypothetical protein